jgi:hypothetical protein
MNYFIIISVSRWDILKVERKRMHVAAMEGYLRFREEEEGLEETLSIHILYTLEGGNFFAVCLDYNEGCSIPLGNYLKYLYELNNEKTMLDLLADSTRELLAMVLDYITSGEGEEDGNLEVFQTEGELWDQYRYFMRSYNSFTFGEGKESAGEGRGPYMRLESNTIKKLIDTAVPGDEYEILNPKLIEPTIVIKKELLDIIYETRKS